ncbi:S66 family peptidase [Bacillus altitudinis]|uniref:S66 family peptidase n=1 Tax=Bacillus altitudinis TaxID=293387 RepID=UPI000C2505F8|nr:S66 peptidase family protein [Bacillus altitudinis]PJI13769.1 LD-carboxypeptidase [Bacillus altitudinis]PKQ86910.1 LD-carboxypeptidase [Bacillus altitudinis]GJI57359.1 LD-carboxypeptidase [Bacillus altitudinis]CAI7727509.1 Microcin C7 self-immunity protein MccF [Bacillus altitudinis]
MKGLLHLQKGDKIGIYSPSSPASATSPLRYERAKEWLEQKGFIVVPGSLTGKEDHYRSGTIQERAAELNELMAREDLSCIMSMIGGTNSNSLLPYLDFELLMKYPKIMIGYSDATAILLAVYEKTGLPVFYGPALVPSFGEFEPFVDHTYQSFEDILIHPQPIPYQVKKPPFWTEERINWEEKIREKEKRPNDWICVIEGQAEGRLIGGNLNAMYGIWGSEFMPQIQKGDILLIEDCMKTASTVEKNFSLLKINGVFERVSGILLGKHELFDDEGTGKRPHDLLLEVLGDTKRPLIAEFDSAHTHPMLTMPIGTQVKMNATSREVWLTEAWI